ncbi:MAG TPA: ABC transporter family substrate-binding protein [Acidimicrobiales bacterium]|nr:ABC transporter family substrate-binding protein [Acidimicrobiales bacterium]
MVVLLAVAAGACSRSPAVVGIDDTLGPPAAGGQVTFAAEQEPTGWNNATATDASLATGLLVDNVYPSAFVQTPELELVMNEDLLVSAEQVSDQPQVVEYRIRDDATWSDGTPITAADFAYAWRQQNGSDPATDVASTLGYDRIASVEGSEEDKVVTVTFAQPYGEWRSLFAQLLAAHVMEALPGGWNDGLDGANLPPFSGGPFALADYVPGESVRLVRNQAWWGEPPLLDAVVVRFGIEAGALPQAMANGEIDVASPSPQIDLVRRFAELAPEITSLTDFGLSYEHLDLNVDNPFLAMPEVREAIALGLDRSALVEATIAQVDERAERLDNRIWLTGQPAYEAHGERYADGDVAGARRLLEEAGFVEGDGGVYHRDGEPLALRISTTGGDRLRESTQLVIVEQLADVGIDVTVDNRDGLAVFEKFFPSSGDPADRDFDLALFAWSGSPFPSDAAPLYAEGSGQNLMGYANPEVDALFAEALAETDSDARDALYNRIDEVLWDDLPTIPLYTKPILLAARSSVASVMANPTSRGPLWNAEEWGLREG